jgi:DNA polymerase-3 subunit epsilon
MDKWHEQLGVFDIETTGIDVETSRIVAAHVGVIDAEGAIVVRRDWIVDPGVIIPDAASAVHGITTEHAQREGLEAVVAIAQIVDEIRTLLSQEIPVVAYNAPYDFTVLNREALRYRIDPLASPAPIIDPLVIDRAVDRYRKGKRTLEVTAEFYGISLADAHNAGADAIAAGRVAQAIARRHATALPLTAHELHALQIAWCQKQADDFQSWMRTTHNPEFTTSGAWPER